MQQMQLIPITILDNFFDDPDKIRNWALSLEYSKDPEGKWPGVRTKSLHEINTNFFDTVCCKFFSLFFDLNQEKMNFSLNMRFQLVDSKYGSGWVHTDHLESQITGLIYLSPNIDSHSGTSIYQEKKNLLVQNHSYNKIKEDFYLNRISHEEAEKYRKEHNSQYEESVKVSNIYNRLIAFDSHLHHAAQDFFGTEKDSRLTLVFFVNELYVNNTPVGKLRRFV